MKIQTRGSGARPRLPVSRRWGTIRAMNAQIPMLFVGAALVCGAAAQSAEPRRVTLDGKDGAAPPKAEAGKDGIDRIHKVEQPQIVVFPAAKRPARGTVMVCPGGGYAILAVNHEGTDIAGMLNDAGWDAAVLLYRVSEGESTRTLALEDAKAGLSLIRKRGSELGLATRRVGVMGFSAGGHLSARLTRETAAESPPDFVALLYPAYLEKDDRCLDEVAPVKTPAFLYVAEDDKYSRSSRAYEAACREKGVSCQAHYAERGGHGFGLKKPLPEGVKDWPEKLRAFLNRLP